MITRNKWEYTVDYVKDIAKLQDILNARGDFQWELVTIVEKNDAWYCFFKRAKN